LPMVPPGVIASLMACMKVGSSLEQGRGAKPEAAYLGREVGQGFMGRMEGWCKVTRHEDSTDLVLPL